MTLPVRKLVAQHAAPATVVLPRRCGVLAARGAVRRSHTLCLNSCTSVASSTVSQGVVGCLMLMGIHSNQTAYENTRQQER
jgi:hypothetical protein